MKKVLVSILAFILCAVFCSCTAMNIEDANGEDTALCSITEEDILSGKLGSTLFGSSRVTLNDNTTYSVKKMSGVLILETIKSSNKDTVFTLTLTRAYKRKFANLVAWRRRACYRFSPG